jgi:hypothetical protein
MEELPDMSFCDFMLYQIWTLDVGGLSWLFQLLLTISKTVSLHKLPELKSDEHLQPS